MPDGAPAALFPPPGTRPSGPDDRLTVAVGVGRRVLVVANFSLGPTATAATTWAASGFARALDTWEGPGLVVVAGNFFDLAAGSAAMAADALPRSLGLTGGALVEAALAAHPRLTEALERFAAGPDRRVVCLPGTGDRDLGSDPAVRRPLEALGAEVHPAVDLQMASVAGLRPVRVEAGVPVTVVPVTGGGDIPDAGAEPPDGTESAGAAPVVTRRAVDIAAVLAAGPSAAAPWQEGIDRLVDPASVQRFLTSRLLYRRFARFGWWLVVPFVVALGLSLPFVSAGLAHLFENQPRTAQALSRVRHATWGTRLIVAAIVSVVEIVVMAGILGMLARRAWHTLGGGRLD
ncbi:MAG: hypothetical protein ACRDY1_11620, partial [Acidimicrobiales bacterium]